MGEWEGLGWVGFTVSSLDQRVAVRVPGKERIFILVCLQLLVKEGHDHSEECSPVSQAARSGGWRSRSQGWLSTTEHQVSDLCDVSSCPSGFPDGGVQFLWVLWWEAQAPGRTGAMSVRRGLG